ncbi:MAG: hypothetical protein WC505_05795 [Patescibacteria group bacterium]
MIEFIDIEPRSTIDYMCTVDVPAAPTELELKLAEKLHDVEQRLLRLEAMLFFPPDQHFFHGGI